MKNVLFFLFLIFSLSLSPFPLSGEPCRKNIQHLKGAETITSADLDMDGNTDLAYTAWKSKELGGELWVAWNNGDGTFTPKRVSSSLKWARDVTVCNLSNSPLPGLCVSAYKSGHFYFYQTSPRSFRRNVLDARGYGSVTHAVGHLNSDNLLDIVTAQQRQKKDEEGHIKIWINMGKNRFLNSNTIYNVKDVSSMQIVRNKDGLNTILVAHSGIENGPSGASAYVFREVNFFWPFNFRLTGPINIINTPAPLGFVTTAYINNDEVLDYLVGSEERGIWWVDGKNPNEGGIIDDRLLGHYFSVVDDLDGDGVVDVASVSLWPTLEVNIYWQKSTGDFVRERVNKGDGGRGITILKDPKGRNKFLAVSSFKANRVDLYSLKCILDGKIKR